jgi:hypothetical protein
MRKILSLILIFGLIACCFAGCKTLDPANDVSSIINPNVDDKNKVEPDGKDVIDADYVVAFGDKKIAFPCTMNELLQAGCSIDDDAKEGFNTTEQQFYEVNMNYKGQYLLARVKVAENRNDSFVYHLTMQGTKNSSYAFNDLKIGEAGADDVKAKFGEPTVGGEAGLNEHFTYEKEDAVLQFNFLNEKLHIIVIDIKASAIK